MPSAWHVRTTRQAISPRFAMRTLLNIRFPSHPACANPAALTSVTQTSAPRPGACLWPNAPFARTELRGEHLVCELQPLREHRARVARVDQVLRAERLRGSKRRANRDHPILDRFAMR